VWTPTWEPNASFCPNKNKNQSTVLLVAEYKKANLEWAQEHHQECVDEEDANGDVVVRGPD
jgi:hypothetical protein